MCAGLESVLERRQHRRMLIFRPLYPVGGQELGYLPGSESDKMGPWAQAVFDTLGAVVSSEVVDEVVARGMLEVLPLTHIRGRSLHDAFVIVDEAQSPAANAAPSPRSSPTSSRAWTSDVRPSQLAQPHPVDAVVGTFRHHETGSPSRREDVGDEVGFVDGPPDRLGHRPRLGVGHDAARRGQDRDAEPV